LTTPISRDDLHRRLANGERLTLVEALGPAYFADAHIPGAVNMPPDQVDRLAPALLPDKDAAIVVYCSGTCHNSEIAARRLNDLGYSDVHVYLGGKEDWVEHGLPVERSDDSD
jgi:rhodanese-related sulfurtransferase